MRNTQLNQFSAECNQTDKYIRINLLEAEKTFVLYFHRQQNESDKIAPDEAIQKLESGEYDADLVEGLRLVAALWHGMHTGCFMLSDEQNLVLWRWTVAAVYVCEMLDTNGAVEVKNEQGEPEEVAVYSGEHGGIVIYPWSERFSLANHVEGLTPKVDKESGEIISNESWLCSPLDVVSIGSDGRDRYLILRWQPEGEKLPVIRAVPLADIGEREGWRTLKAGGVNVTTKSNLRAILADWLQRNGHGQLWQVAHTTGWQCGAYIMPDACNRTVLAGLQCFRQCGLITRNTLSVKQDCSGRKPPGFVVPSVAMRPFLNPYRQNA